MKPTKDKYNLKPCPFCGGEAEVALFLGNYTVCCSACSSAVVPNPYSDTPLDEAVVAWNRRATVEVVRCGDCKYFNENALECLLEAVPMQPDDFCSYGRKKAVEQEATE